MVLQSRWCSMCHFGRVMSQIALKRTAEKSSSIISSGTRLEKRTISCHGSPQNVRCTYILNYPRGGGVNGRKGKKPGRNDCEDYSYCPKCSRRARTKSYYSDGYPGPWLMIFCDFCSAQTCVFENDMHLHMLYDDDSNEFNDKSHLPMLIKENKEVALIDCDESGGGNQRNFQFNQAKHTPKKICDYLCEYVIGQDQAKKVVSVAVYNHYKRMQMKKLSKGKNTEETKIDKRNILILGPTGTGKTLLAQTVARYLGVPFSCSDCSAMTSTGYVGGDVENIINSLFQSADEDVRKTQTGIVYLDEIDKIAARSTSQKDIGGEGVQQELLKILEGTTVQLKNSSGAFEFVDTTDILFITSGAFTGLDHIVKKRMKEKSLGFGSHIAEPPIYSHLDLQTLTSQQTKEELSYTDKLLYDVEMDDLIKFGMIPELCGRLPVVVATPGHTIDTLVKILSEPKNNLVSQYQQHFKFDNVELHFTSEAMYAIAKKATERKTGARALKSLMERVLLEPMFEVPGSGVNRVEITESVVTGSCKPTYITHNSPSAEKESNKPDSIPNTAVRNEKKSVHSSV